MTWIGSPFVCHECNSTELPPVGRNRVENIVTMACKSDFGHRQREAGRLVNCRPWWHGQNVRVRHHVD